MEVRKRPQVKPIQTGSTGIRSWERRSSRARSVPLPSPLRCSISSSDLPFTKDSPYQPATKTFPKTPYPHHNGPGLANQRLTRRQRKIQLARLDSIHANTVFSPRIANGPKTSPLDSQVARLMSFQRYRDALWSRGSHCLSNHDDADVFVNAVSIRGTPAVDEESPTSPRSQPIRVVVHSKGRRPFGLTRQFDMDHLRETVPDASPSPRSAGFDKEALLSAVLQQAAKSPGAIPETDGFRNGISSPEEASADSRTSQTQSLGLPIRKSRPVELPNKKLTLSQTCNMQEQTSRCWHPS